MRLLRLLFLKAERARAQSKLLNCNNSGIMERRCLRNQIYVVFLPYRCAEDFHLIALTPPIVPSMKPIMNPPPVITLGKENTIINIPNAFLFSGLIRKIIAPKNTRTPHISPITAIVANGTIALLSDPGSVGKIQGKYAPAAPTATALQTIKIPAIREKVKADFGFSLCFIPNQSRTFFASSFVQLRISSQSRKS